MFKKKAWVRPLGRAQLQAYNLLLLRSTVLIRIFAPSSELIMDLISVFFCHCVIPCLLFLGSWRGTHIVVICHHARLFTVHILLPVPWVNSLETL